MSGAPADAPGAVFGALAFEACDRLGLAYAVVLRCDGAGPARIVAAHNAPAELAVGGRWPVDGAHALVEVPILLEGERWGMVAAPASSPESARADSARLAAFADMAATAIATAQTTAELRGLAAEQAALRRVAELVAGGATRSRVFDAVAHEACRLLGGHFTALLCFEAEGRARVVAMDGAEDVEHVMQVGMRLSDDGDGIVQRVQRLARAIRIDSYAGLPGANAATARALGLTSGVGAPVVVEGRVWGAITVLGVGPPLPATAEARLGMFAELVATAISNAQARANLRVLAEEQTALRRVAELVARGVDEREIFDAVATEASKLLDGRAMTLTRFIDDRTLDVVATSGGPAPVGTRIDVEPETLPDRVRRDARTERVDDYTRERDAALATRFGLAAAVSAPISVEGEVWGMLTATSDRRPLPAGTEDRLAQFAKLIAAALANSQARAELQALADEQTALRRIAELTAQDAPAEAVLRAVAIQASRLAGVEFGMVLRFEPDGSNEIVALDGAPANFAVGMRAPAAGDGAAQRVWRTGRAARIDDLGAMSGQWPRMAARYGFATSAGVPILLHGRLWGAIIVVGRDGPMPPAIETHLADFAELVGTAISATEARAELRVLADEQAALRRVAELVARGAALEEVFGAITDEASVLLGEVAALLRGEDPGESVTVAVPIIVEGRVWGTLATGASGAPLPDGAEARLAQFAELAAAAIANAENKAKLTASRARVVATADETRRRIQRDLHDGSQQRLVHALITLQIARDAAARGEPAAELIEEALHHAERANSELRDLVSGIMPASLTTGGLRTGLESLVGELALPVELHVTAPRLPTAIETTAYFIVAEAVTNVVKHARATRATVDVALRDGHLSIEVRDDGAGGADPAHGTGLTGLLDRVEASAGTLAITSVPRQGTTLHATLPARRA